MTISGRRLAVIVHALLVLPLVVVFVVVGSGVISGGASFGTVVLSLPVLLAGAPWSVLTAQFAEGASPGVVEFLVAFPAVLNVGLHLAVGEHFARRRAAAEAAEEAAVARR